MDTIHKLEHLFTELDKLNCVLPDAFKRNAVLLQLREVAPEIYTTIAVKTDMKFSGTVAEVKKLAALNSAVDKTAGGREPTAGAFFSRNKPKRWATEKKGWKVQPNQCFWCLNFGHMVQKCPSREKGEDPKPRPDGSLYKGRFPKGGEGTKSFQSFCFVSEANRLPGGPWLVDSGCNRYMTPVKGDLSNMQPSNIEYTLGNKEKLSAKCSGKPN